MTSTEDAAVILWLANELVAAKIHYHDLRMTELELIEETARWIQKAREAVRKQIETMHV
jgi:hypothetical protein